MLSGQRDRDLPGGSRDGHFSTVGAFRLTNGYGYWGSPAPGNPGSLAGARLITPNGHVLATATFRPGIAGSRGGTAQASQRTTIGPRCRAAAGPAPPP